ncbi:MAG: HAD family phosphatase [Bacteroidetes bacterium]|nr:HAD family phosphatase [Bacteroidota bacterium]
MLVLRKNIPNAARIRNIIFDFGGVVCDIDIKKTEEKFISFGPAKAKEEQAGEDTSKAFENLVRLYETGSISSDEFRKAIRDHYQNPPAEDAIDEAWNALLIGIPEQRIQLLETIRKNYRIFLLSNSNAIHYSHYLAYFQTRFGYRDFNGLFEKAFFSFQIHLSKPGKEIFEYVLKHAELDPAETLFVDDFLVNIQGAGETGIVGYHLKPSEEIAEMFIPAQ